MNYKELLNLIVEALQKDIDPELVNRDHERAKNVVRVMNDNGLIVVTGDEMYDEVRENLRKKDLTCVK